jgi:hypothetical protein
LSKLSIWLLALALAGTAFAEDPPDGGEGALRNDTFLVTDKAAEAQLARGDRALSAARARSAGMPAEALDAWRAAIENSSANAAVAALASAPTGIDWPDPSDTLERRTEAVSVALLRRLSALSPGERAAWHGRFGPLASQELAAAPFRTAALARLERVYPGTRAAAVAALRLADVALESGNQARAASYLGRAAIHGGLAPSLGQQWQAHLDSRLGRLPQPAAAPGTPTSAPKWRSVRSQRLEARQGSVLPGRRPPRGVGLMPGASLGPDGDILIQTARALIWLDAAALSTARGGKTQLSPYEDWLQLPAERTFVPPAAGGWPMVPLQWGSEFVVVVARGIPARLRGDLTIPARGNHLVAATRGDLGQIEVRWSLSGPGLLRPGIPVRLASEVLGPGIWEFQPGPVHVGDLLVVLARGLESGNEPKVTESGPESAGLLRLVALDWQSGELVWSIDLARTSDLFGSQGEAVGLGTQTQQASMPLASAGSHVLIGTHAGALACVDASDGRLEWQFRNQRRRPDESSWPGSRAPLLDGPRAWFTPADSDFLYALPAGPAPLEGPFLQARPLARGQREVLASAGPGGLVFLGRDGRHRALLRRNRSGIEQACLYLGAEERFRGAPASTGGQLLIATDRSFMAFRESDLLLESSLPLLDLGATIGGTVVPIPGGAVVVGADTLWVLASQP